MSKAVSQRLLVLHRFLHKNTEQSLLSDAAQLCFCCALFIFSFSLLWEINLKESINFFIL